MSSSLNRFQRGARIVFSKNNIIREENYYVRVIHELMNELYVYSRCISKNMSPYY